ncbi:hypothetical protein PVAP13_9NG677700 [Panicum virgatum]|uniref:Uncharacterized protein n=1 Tax=Panicum virgatum TaxID=38727 RepID=A0A8T0N306_PANVG|nr:hypothetical protein PVAP13_9NG677700 [Panicum virgatum]
MRARRAASIGSLPCRAAPLRCSPMPSSSLSRAAHYSLPHAPLFFLPSLFFFLLYSELEQSHGWPPSLGRFDVSMTSQSKPSHPSLPHHHLQGSSFPKPQPNSFLAQSTEIEAQDHHEQ